MGHIILIAEELVKFLARCPHDLYELIAPSFVLSEWEAFVHGRLRETKAMDAKPLAGGKPSILPVPKPEEVDKDSSSDEDEEPAGGHKFGEPLTRTVAQDGYAGRTGYDSFADREDDEEVSVYEDDAEFSFGAAQTASGVMSIPRMTMTTTLIGFDPLQPISMVVRMMKTLGWVQVVVAYIDGRRFRLTDRTGRQEATTLMMTDGAHSPLLRMMMAIIPLETIISLLLSRRIIWFP